MPKIMTMPKLGVNMTEAKVISWAAKEGDTVNNGDHILDIETDKAVQEITANVSGVLAKILVKVGETAKCQDPIAVFIDEGEESIEDFNEYQTDSAVSNIEDSPGQSREGSIRISPLAKKMAMDLGLDYTKIPSPATGARIEKVDVLSFSSNHSPKDKTRVISLSGTRKVIAERMSLSVRTTARAVLSLHASAEKIIEWREVLKKDGRNVSYNELIVAIVGLSLSEFPIMNSRLVGDEIHLLSDINIGVALDTEQGLLVPVIHNADQKNILAINDDFRGKLERARAGKCEIEDLTGGTFTITNLGMFEIESFTPIINPPECGIIGVGAIVREPVIMDDCDTVKVRPRLQLTLAFDHRIVDGAPAARFMQRIKHLIELPTILMS